MENQPDRALEAFARGLTAPSGYGSALQWIIAGMVGIVLGIYTLGVSSVPAQWASLLILSVLLICTAMIVGNVRKLLLTIMILDIPLQLDIHLGYSTEAAELGAIGGWSISATTIALCLLYASWLAERLSKPLEAQSRPSVRPSLPLVVYLGFTVLSMLAARDVKLSLFEIFLLLQMFLLYVYIIGTVHTREDILFMVTVILIGLVLESAVMIGLRYVGQDFSIAGMLGRIDVRTGATGESYRVGGTVGAPNTAASYLSLLLAPAMGVLITRLGAGYKRLGALAFGLGGIALVLTLSRGGWLASFVSLSILCLFAFRRGWLPPIALLIITVVAVLVAFLFGHVVLSRLSGYEPAASAQARIPLMELAFRVIMDNPVLGVGANNYAIVIEEYATRTLGGAWLYTVHNDYLRIWAEIGLGGLIAYISFLVLTIRRGWRCWMAKDRFLSPLALGFAAGILGHMVHMLFDLSHQRNVLQALWLGAGLITAMGNILGNYTSERRTHTVRNGETPAVSDG